MDIQQKYKQCNSPRKAEYINVTGYATGILYYYKKQVD